MNPILKRVVTGLAVGAAVIALILLAPPWAILPAVACLIVLAVALAALWLLLRRYVVFETELPLPAGLGLLRAAGLW